MSADEIIARLHAEQVDRVELAVAAGGLPTENEVKEVETRMQAVFDLLEEISSRIVGIADSADGEELPSVISLEEIGRVAVLLALIDRYMEDYGEMAEEMRKQIFSLSAIRGTQLMRKAS